MVLAARFAAVMTSYVVMKITPRRARLAAVMTVALVGSGLFSQTLAGSPTPAAVHFSADARSCPQGTTLAAGPGVSSNLRTCEPLGQPETFADLASLSASINARTGSNAPGAYQAALRQRAAITAAGAVPGSAGTWAPYGTSPECAGPSTVAGGPCAAAGAANGGYSETGQLGFVTLSGRISSFADDPTTPGRFFASPTVGGVFESTDGGKTWASIGDGLPTQAVGAIAYDVPLHRILVGSGDNSFSGTGIAGHGFFYSDDDGATWSTASGFPDLAVSFRVALAPADGTGHTFYVASSKGLFRSTDGGATLVNTDLPTSPAGYSPNCAGDTTTPLCFFANIVTDVVVKGSSSSNAPAGAVMAVVGWRAGERQDTLPGGAVNMSCSLNGSPTACLQAPQNGLYISTTGVPGSFAFQDQGQTASPTTKQGFAPDTVVGRTALGIASGTGQNNDAVYALVEDATKFQGCPDVLDTGNNPSTTCNATVTGEGLATYLDGMYATYDFGHTWTKIMDYTQTKYTNTNSSLLGQAGYSPGIQSWYNLWVAPDPSSADSSGDPQRVAFGLEEIWENNQLLTPPAATGLGNPVLHDPWEAHTTPGPATDPWVVIGRYWNACGSVNTGVPCNANLQNNPIPGTTTHPDQHAALFVLDGSGGVTLFAGSDGGVYSQHVAAGADFTNDNWGDGNNVGIYSQQPYDAEIANDGTVVAGLQDNGEDKISPNGGQAEIFGGDAFYNTIDPNNSNNILEEYTYGAASLSNDGGSTWSTVTPSNCSSSTALFATPIEQDPTQAGHIVMGCNSVYEETNGYSGGSFNDVFDLGTEPSGAEKIPSAVGVRGSNIYVGFCGYCDVVTGGLPFVSGIATNAGGTWHYAAAACSNCNANGLLPQRYITSIQVDPTDPNTVYVTMGGYGRRWIPPGALGDDTSLLGSGHVFVSHDAGNTFSDVSGNLPDVPANWTLVHDGNLVVATDLGVYESTGTGGVTFGQLGNALPNAPVFTIRLSPSNPDEMVAATFGRGVWKYTFTDLGANVPESVVVPLLPATGLAIIGVVLWRRRRRSAFIGS